MHFFCTKESFFTSPFSLNFKFRLDGFLLSCYNFFMKDLFTWKRNLLFALLSCFVLYIDGFVYFGIAQKFFEGKEYLHFASNIITSIIWAIGIVFLWVRPIYIKRRYRFKKTQGNFLLYVILCISLIAFNRLCNNSWLPNVIRSYTPYVTKFEPYGVATFVMQHIYYLLEAGIMTMIVYFFQEFGELKFRNARIPYGAVGLALFWGLAHMVSKGVIVGLVVFCTSIFVGLSYNVTKKNVIMLYGISVILFYF